MKGWWTGRIWGRWRGWCSQHSQSCSATHHPPGHVLPSGHGPDGSVPQQPQEGDDVVVIADH